MEDFRETLDRLGRVRAMDLFFIVGWTKTGTCWLERAIDAHADACCRGEGHFTNVLFPLLVQAFTQYNKQLRLTNERLDLADVRVANEGFGHGDLNFMLSTAISLTMSRWAEETGVRCIGEKTPEHTLGIDVLGRVMPEARFVHVIRDGRDEAVTAWRFNMGLDPEGFSKKYPSFAHFVEAYARNWTAAVGKARAFGRIHRDNYLELRCEDLMSEPETDLFRLFGFLGLDGGDVEARTSAEAANEALLPDSEPGIWRDLFDDESQAAFRRHGGELLKLLGYED